MESDSAGVSGDAQPADWILIAVIAVIVIFIIAGIAYFLKKKNRQ